MRTRRASKYWSELYIPKVGWVCYRYTRPLKGRIRNATITLEPDGTWWVGYQLEQRERPIIEEKKAPRETTCGVDLGVAITAATSNGEMFHVPGLTPKEKERKLRLERKRSRQVERL